MLEALNAEALDGGAEAVEAGLYPGLLDGQRLARVVRTHLVHHALGHRHEVGHSHIPA